MRLFSLRFVVRNVQTSIIWHLTTKIAAASVVCLCHSPLKPLIDTLYDLSKEFVFFLMDIRLESGFFMTFLKLLLFNLTSNFVSVAIDDFLKHTA